MYFVDLLILSIDSFKQLYNIDLVASA